MIFNRERIKKDSQRVYKVMKIMKKYSYDELQKISKLKDTDLCMAIGELIRENKLTQRKGMNDVYYTVRD